MEYDWKLVNDPYLDGIILGAGVPRNRYTVNITVSDLPADFCEELRLQFIDLDYEADFIEQTNAMTKNLDLKLEVCGSEPIFNILPRLSERRFDVKHVPIDFIKGYLISIANPIINSSTYGGKTNDGIRFRKLVEEEEIVKMLSVLGVLEYQTTKMKNVFLPVDVCCVDPFKKLMDYAYFEYQLVENYVPSREEIIDNKIKKHMNKIKQK